MTVGGQRGRLTTEMEDRGIHYKLKKSHMFWWREIYSRLKNQTADHKTIQLMDLYVMIFEGV